MPTKAETSEELVNAISQNSQDDAEVVNIEDIPEPGVDEVQLQPEDDEDGDEKLYLYFPDPDKPPMGFWFEDEYAQAYNDLMLQMVRCGLKPEEKRTKLKELEQANEKTMVRFSDKAVIAELKEKRIQYNKGLSIEAKEQTDG